MVTTTTSAPAASTPSWLTELTKGLDMLQNFNFAQIGDFIQSTAAQAGSNPVGAVESVANAVVHAGAVAGIPIAVEADAVLPIAEELFGFMQSFTGLFGGTSSAAADQAKAISSPSMLSPQHPVGTAGSKPTGIV